MPLSPSLAMHSEVKSTRLRWLSSSVTRVLGDIIFIGRPGKPAPEPTSSSRLSSKSAAFSRAQQSRKWARAVFSSPVIAVRSMTALRSARYS